MQPECMLMAQADQLGPEVGGHLALWAAFISPRPCNDSRVVYSCYGALEIVGVIIISIIIIIGHQVTTDNNNASVLPVPRSQLQD